MEDKILFIMPSINRDTITRAVQSVKSQTDNRWHLCIVYDNVDNPKIKEQDNITCINLDSKLGVGTNGAGNVRNVAIDRFQEQYKWIGFIDDDDTIDNKYVHLLFSKYSKYDIVVFRMKNGSIIPPRGSQKLEKCKVGISFCCKTPLKARFIPSQTEDYNLLQQLKSKNKSHIVTDEICYYVRS